MVKCRHCGDEDLRHQEGRHGHRDLCCDCFDLSCGMPIDKLNAERAEAGKPPVGPWPKVKHGLNPGSRT